MDAQIDLLQSITEKDAALLAGVPGDAWEWPTPCAEYDVRRLTDHMVGWARRFATITNDEPEAEGDGDSYVAGDDPSAEYRDATDRVIAALRAGGLDRTYGQTPGTMLVGLLAAENIAHGWDLATALGEPTSYTDEEVRLAYDTSVSTMTDDYRGEGQPFGHVVPAPDDATRVEEFVAFMGRDPRATLV